ncbi:MAG: excinuclease ABC subunit A, partial [Arcobacter sp.]|nr:excinuclease ABC subunit A [Arcobacter sp.]
MNDKIKIYNANENNLKNVSLEIPKNKLIVFTGLSGSGKSTLAFDTLYAEGQRRYIESLSAYARQFLGKIGKPDVERIEGLTPAIAIDQKTTSKNPRSTVGTITEIYDYLRLLFARIGKVHCYKCGSAIQSQSAQEIVDSIMASQAGNDIQILAPLIQGKKGLYKDIFAQIQKSGFVRARVDGEIFELSAKACFDCKISFEPLEPLSFSFNSPKGACTSCDGLGIRYALDMKKVINEELSIDEGAVKVIYGFNKGYYFKMLLAYCEGAKINTKIPFRELEEHQKGAILHGGVEDFSFFWKRHKLTRKWEGIVKIAYDMIKDDKDSTDYMT